MTLLWLTISQQPLNIFNSWSPRSEAIPNIFNQRKKIAGSPCPLLSTSHVKLKVSGSCKKSLFRYIVK